MCSFTHFIKLTTNMYNDYIHNPQKINWPHQQNYIHLSKIYQLGFKILFAAKMVESNLLFQRFFNCSGDLSRPIVPFEYRYEQIRFEPLLLIQKLNKLISVDWYLFTPYFSNCLSHEERRKDVFLLSVLLRQFPLNSFQFLNAGWYKNITHLLAWIISITSWMIHNKIKQSAQFENIYFLYIFILLRKLSPTIQECEPAVFSVCSHEKRLSIERGEGIFQQQRGWF